jgi:alkanesulfonate monooxygenase SsuD/methylene tetrahydromethanopterin reductase-like flavin-dependent oxidoreductase (luciferase family)
MRYAINFADPWNPLDLIADRTESVLIGTSVTTIARRRPVKLAREILTLNQLAGDRFILGRGQVSRLPNLMIWVKRVI